MPAEQGPIRAAPHGRVRGIFVIRARRLLAACSWKRGAPPRTTIHAGDTSARPPSGIAQSPTNPFFTLTAMVTLALALGTNVAVFSLLNALAFRRLPVRHPEELVQVATRFRTGEEGRLSFPMFRELASRQNVFSSVIGWWGNPI